jgi:pilus assembly protein CpaF
MPRTSVERELLQSVLMARRSLLEQYRDDEPAEMARRIRTTIHEECEAYQRRAATTNLPLLRDPAATEEWMRDELLGMSVLEQLMRRPDVQTIFVNTPFDIRAIVDGHMQRLVGLRFRDDRHVRELVKRFASLAGREFDTAHPSVNVALPDGSRLHAIMPPLTEEFTTVTIRRFTLFNRRLPYFVEQGMLSSACASLVSACARGKANIVLAGDTGTGKTSLLRGIALEIDDPDDRMLTIEDPRELRLDRLLDGCIALEARPPNSEGKGRVTMNELLERDALKMEPTRIVIGECIGSEAYTFLKALDTGHRGSFTSIHARSARDALDRLLGNALEAAHRPNEQLVLRRIANNVDLILFLEKRPPLTISSSPLIATGSGTASFHSRPSTMSGRPRRATAPALPRSCTRISRYAGRKSPHSRSTTSCSRCSTSTRPSMRTSPTSIRRRSPCSPPIRASKSRRSYRPIRRRCWCGERWAAATGNR